MFFTTKSSTAMSTSMMSSLERAVIVINGKNILVITMMTMRSFPTQCGECQSGELQMGPEVGSPGLAILIRITF